MENTMKNTLIKSIIILSSLTFGVANGAEKNYSLPLSNPSEPASLKVELYRGTVRVIGYQGDKVEITANISVVENKDLSAKEKKITAKIAKKLSQHGQTKTRSIEGLKAVNNSMLHLEIEEENNEVEITSESMNQYVDLVIKVPSKSSVELEVYQGGDIHVEDIQGSLELESFQGGITASNVSGPLVAETYTQDIVINFSDFDKASPTSLTSYTGNVDISLAKSIKANVNVQTYQGKIFSGLDSDFIPNEDVKKQSKKGKKQKIVIGGMMQAKVNGGGQELSLITYSGNLYIRKEK